MKARKFRKDLLLRLPRERVVLLRELDRLADERNVHLYLVGGVVRDLLLGRKDSDLDLAVEGDGIAFAQSVAKRFAAGIVLFERFATARLTFPAGDKVDIASTRRESYATPAALPEVRPSASLREDLYRRDFTVNAMAIQLDGVWFGLLHDPYGGSVDLRRKRLRVLHEGSFSDDPTRIFRAIRFMQRFGFQVERSTKHWLIQAASTNLINRLSAPRLGNEILLLLDERYPAKAIQILARLQLLRFLHARLRYREKAKYVVAGIARTLTWWKSHNLAQFDRSLLYLMALLSETERSVTQTVARRLALSAKQCRTVEWAGRRTDRIVEELSRRQAESPSRVYRLLDGAPHEAILLALAKCRDPSRNGAERRCRQRILRYLKKDRNVTITIKGEDLMRLGLKSGPQYKKILDRLLNARLDGNVTTEAEERELAHDLVKKARPHVDATVGVIANRSRSY